MEAEKYSDTRMEANNQQSAAAAVPGKKQLLPYFHLSQGQGGIFTLPFYGREGVNVDCIGTHSCWTCVCVYVRLDDERCFVAHIDGHTRSIFDDLEWVPEGQQQRISLKLHMAEEFKKALPEPFKDLSQAEKEALQKSIVIVCPRMKVAHPDDGIEVEATGAVIVQAFREHLEISPPAEPEDLAHGFVVNHKTQVVTKLVWDQAAQPTAEVFLATDRAMNRLPNHRTAAEHDLVKNHPLMQPPEVKGFFEVPGRPWTVIYDHDMLGWRRMGLLDFHPFIPLPYDHSQRAEEQGQVRSRRDGKVILGSPMWEPSIERDPPKKFHAKQLRELSKGTAAGDCNEARVLAAAVLALSAAICVAMGLRYWRA